MAGVQDCSDANGFLCVVRRVPKRPTEGHSEPGFAFPRNQIHKLFNTTKKKNKPFPGLHMPTSGKSVMLELVHQELLVSAFPPPCFLAILFLHV